MKPHPYKENYKDTHYLTGKAYGVSFESMSSRQDPEMATTSEPQKVYATLENVVVDSNPETIPEDTIPRIKRNSFSDDKCKALITPTEMQKVINLSKSLRFERITDFQKMRTLFGSVIPDKEFKKFFDAMEKFPDNSGLALFDGQEAGIICCVTKNYGTSLHIMAIGVLPNFRRRGIAGALLHHVINKIADSLETVRSISLHARKEDIDAIRLFERFGFARWRAAKTEPNAPYLFVRPVIRPSVVPVQMSASTRVGFNTEITVAELRTLNKSIFGVDYVDDLHNYVIANMDLYAYAISNSWPVGSMICEKSDSEGLTFLEILKLGVLPGHEESAVEIQQVLVNRAFEIAEDSGDVDVLTFYVQNDQTATIDMLTECGFKPWLPIPDFYRHNTFNSVFYVKETTKLAIILSEKEREQSVMEQATVADKAVATASETAPIAAETVTSAEEKALVAVEAASTAEEKALVAQEQTSVSNAHEKPDVQDITVDMRKLDISKMDMKNRLLHIEDITEDTVKVFNQLVSAVSPASIELFHKVLDAQSLTCLAFFNERPIGYIRSQMIRNSNGTFHLSIVTLGVLPDFRGFGVGGELIKHLVKLAQQTDGIEFLSTIVPGADTVASRLFLRNDFRNCGSLSEGFETLDGCLFFKSSN
uniref:N-terminal methionine N(alpha)-acetyltransferase NatE n=2 Tax=Caenorhabditis tropicalis TaxID=1561998 RepID=A0A1I7TI40_9PELO